jgi:hypothetical protein
VPSAFGLATHLPVAASQAPTLHSVSSAEQSTAAPFTHLRFATSQTSTPLQGFLSSQSALVVHGHALVSVVQPPSFSEQLSALQAMPSLHVSFVPLQTPFAQTSVEVQVCPSLHEAPLGLAGLVHLPVAASHVPARWQLSEATQTTPAEGVQLPFWHASPVVHGLPSSHLTPFCLLGLEQIPVLVLHTPLSWHWSLGLQLTGAEPTQAPA